MNQNTKLPYDPIYHEIFNKLDDAIIIFKKDEFLECNSKTIKLLALENIADIKDINPFDITPTHQPDGMLSYLKYEEKLLECAIKNSVKFEWLFISKNNEEIFVEIILKKHIIDDEEIFVAKIRELNEVKEFEQEIKKRDILIVQKSNYINQINDILDKNNIDENTYLEW